MNNKTEILNELKALSPLLLQVKENELPLSVPNHYFEQLADTIIAEIKIESGILSSLKKEKSEAPPAYFENFADHILSKIKAEEKEVHTGKIIELPKSGNHVYHWFRRVGIAAAVIGSVFLIKNVQQPSLPVNNCTDGIACLTQDEIYHYMDEHSHEFDIQQIQETVQPALEKTDTKTGIKKEEATQYIEKNNNVLDVDDASTDIF